MVAPLDCYSLLAASTLSSRRLVATGIVRSSPPYTTKCVEETVVSDVLTYVVSPTTRLLNEALGASNRICL